MHWAIWIERYRDRGYHDIPVQIALGVMMQESRGSPTARGVDGEIGLFQILPSSVSATVAELEQLSKNIYHGIGLLESYTWEADALVNGYELPYRDLLYSAISESSDMEWWRDDEGRTALAMYQCGPSNIRDGDGCGRHGGYIYADTVLSCWVPWIVDILKIEEVIQPIEPICIRETPTGNICMI